MNTRVFISTKFVRPDRSSCSAAIRHGQFSTPGLTTRWPKYGSATKELPPNERFKNDSKDACDPPKDLQAVVETKYPGTRIVSLSDLNEDDRALFSKGAFR